MSISNANSSTGTAIVGSLIDAKGDLLVGTADNVIDRLAVSTQNGDTIVADSSTSTGLRYQVGNGLAQGIINGGMDIWQRGTSFTNGGFYTADRWYFDVSAGTVTSTRESTIVPAGFQYSFKINKSAGSASASGLQQTIETANAVQYAGKTVVVSAYCAADTATSFYPTLEYSTAVDNPRSGSWTSITPTVDGATTVSTTTFVRVASTYAVPSTAKSLRLTYAPTLASNSNIYISGIQLEIASVATAFRKATGTIQGELAACQRYYFRMTSLSNTYARFGIGFAQSTSLCRFFVNFPVQMRTAPTSLDNSAAGTFNLWDGVTDYTVTTVNAIENATPNNCTMPFSATSLTQFRSYIATALNTTTAFLGFSAEL